jgi:LuxR family transcriptional regulator, regulator of acetate metabolism
VRLEHPLIEAELVRRRRATLVEDSRRDPRVDPTMSAIMGWEAYVAAPIAVRSSVVGVVHAGRRARRPLRAEHCDVLWEFADGLAHAYETATLRRSLRRERERMRTLLDRLGQRSRELGDAPIDLVPPEEAPSPRAEHVAPEAAERPGLEGVLTRREREILSMLAEGRTNRAIAAELVISPGTVKFHVNRILRKLRVANRAEAVSRYFALLGGPVTIGR